MKIGKYRFCWFGWKGWKMWKKCPTMVGCYYLGPITVFEEFSDF